MEEIINSFEDILLSKKYINSLPGLFYVFSEDKFITWNNAWNKITGYNNEELANMYGNDFFEGADKTHIEEQMYKVFHEGIADAEASIITKDGRKIPFYFTGKRKNLNGINYLIGMGIDITIHKQAVELLRESEFFLKETQKVARLGGWKLNPETDFLAWTEGVYDIIEAPLDYKPGLKDGLKYYVPKYLPALKEKIQRCYTHGDPFTEECEIITGSGKRLWTEVRGVVRVEEGKNAYVYGTFQDITDRKHVEELLQESEEKYRLLVENIPSVTWISSEHGKTTFISPNVEKMFGHTQKEVYEEGESIWLGRIHPDDSERVITSFMAMFDEQKKFDVEYRIQRKDGQWVWIHDIGMSAFEKDNIRYAYGVFSDITERKHAEEELKQSENKLKLAEKARDMLWGIFNYVDSMSLILDENLKIVLVNRYAAKMLGYKEANELVGKDWLDFIPQDQKNIVKNVHNKIMNNSKEVEDHISSVISKHKTIPIRWFISRLDEGNKGTFSIGVPIIREINEQTNIDGVRSYFKNMIQKDKESINNMRELIGKNGE